MKEKSSIIRNSILICIGAVLQLLPLGYWMITEGRKSLYEELHFFPHYFVMVLLSIAAAIINCMVNKKWIRKEFCLAWELLIGFLLLAVPFLVSVVRILWDRSLKGMFLGTVWVLFLMALYIFIQGVIYAVTEVIFCRFTKNI